VSGRRTYRSVLSAVSNACASVDFEGLRGGTDGKRFVLISEWDVERMFMRRLRQG